MGWEGALATIVEDPLTQVFVALYDVAPMDEESMDRWESVGLEVYRRLRVRVHTLDGEEMAWTYVLNGYEGVCRPHGTWARSRTPRSRPGRRTTM